MKAAERRKNTAHSASCGWQVEFQQAPKGRKNGCGADYWWTMSVTFAVHCLNGFDQLALELIRACRVLMRSPQLPISAIAAKIQ